MSSFDVNAVDLSGILNKSNEEKARQLPDPATLDRKSTRLNSSHIPLSRMPSSA